MLNNVQTQFSNKFSTSNISITLTVNNHTIYLVTYMTSNMEDVFFFLLHVILFDMNIK